MKQLYTSLFALLSLFVSFQASAQVTASFSANLPTPACNPAVVSFTNTSTGIAPLSYEWNFGVYSGTNSIFTNPSTTYLTCGTYTVSLIVTDGNGDSDTTTQDITINCSPTADFSVSSNTGCAPFDVVYTDNSNPGSGTIQTITWDFGDGYLGNGDGVTHTYNVIGCNTVTQIVTNSFGCTADTTIGSLICVAAQPTLSISSPNATACAAPFTTTFDANITGGVGPFTYNWTFDNGTPATDTTTNPSVEFSAAGSYDVSLSITDVNGCTVSATQTNYINVAANTIGITANAFEGCAPFQFDFTAVTNNTPQSYGWSVTETGQTATGQNAIFTFNTPGTYTICLDIVFSGGCTAQNCTTVVVHDPPTAAFAVSGNAPTCIRPSQLTFTNNSFGDTLSYNWSFPGGSPSASADSVPPAITYVSCGTFSASLFVTDVNGCTASDAQNNMFTITCPVADFNVDIIGGCVPLTVTFSDSSVGNPVQWEWDFGDGSTGTGSSPSHTFTTEGCFTVTLITTTVEGCKDTVSYTDLVCAGSLPDVSFTSNPPVACADEPITFTNTSTNIFPYTTYSWDFVGVPPYDEMSTLMNPVYVYEDTGWFDVTLIASNYGCNDTLTIDNMEHILPPVAIPQLTRSCATPLVITLSGTQSLGADTYTWTIPGGNPSTATTPTVTVTYTVGGNYSASLYVTNDTTNCDHQATINIPVRDVEAEFTGSPLQGCATLNACMTNQSVDAVSYQWLVTNNATGATVATSTQTNPCFSLSNAGVYNVRLIATDMFGCRDTILKPAYITVWRPTPGFYGTPLTGCTPLFVQFTDTSFATTSTIVSWSWNFGDPTSGVNNTSTLQNPSHVYNNPGYYNVSLTVTDNHGCSRSLTKSNYVHAVQPNADFVLNNTSVCSGAVTCLTNASSGSSLTYAWDFGNGFTSTSSAPCVTYTDTGWFDVTLIVTDSYGCTDTTVKQNYIQVTFPSASFVADTTNSSCPPLVVSFQNTSFGGVSYQWQFGDNSVSNAPNPTHIYNQAGSYDVTLIVTNAAGCQDTLFLQDYIVIGGPQATVAAPVTNGCAPLQACFHAFSSTTIAYVWNFGDGTVTTGADTICYTYTQPGTYNPELIVNDGLGCIYALPIGQINVGGAMASFIIPANDLCGPGSITFQDQSTSPFGITSHAWDFGDPASGAQNTSTSTNPSHYFASAGEYIVTLTVTSSDGCVSTSQDTVNVNDLPIAAFATNDTVLCLPAQIQFTDSSYSAAGIAQWSWDFNDGDTSNQQNPLHDYLSAGTYNVTLTVVDSNGCTDDANLSLTINPPVTVDAGPDQGVCIGDSVSLSATGGASFVWTPATGLSSSSISNPVASPSVTTTYTVYSASFGGCDGTDSVVVTINTPPQIDTVEAYGEVCALSNGQAWSYVNGGSYPYNYLWSNGSTDSLATNLSGNSIYNVTVTDANGCSTSSTVFVDAVAPPFISQTIQNETCGASNGSITVTVPVGMPPFTYNWSNGATDDILTNLSAGSYSVTVTDGMGCTATITCTVTNQASPVLTLYASDATCGSANGSIDAQVAGNMPFTFLWSNAETTEDITGLSNGTYTLTVSDVNGCSTVDSTIVIAANSPVVSETHVDATCELANGTIDVTTVGGTAPFVYTWNTNYAFTEDLTNVLAGTYDLVVSDANGCTATLNVVITSAPVAQVSFNITDAVCSMANGSVITTIVTGGTAPFTFMWSNGSTDQDLTNVVAGAYTITVTDAQGCTSSATANVNNITGPALTSTAVSETCGNANGSVNIDITGGTAPFTFLWSNGATTEDIDSVSANTYTATVTDANGCEANITTAITNQSGPSLSGNVTNSTCGAANGNITLLTAGGTMPYTYNWNTGATTQNITNALVGTYAVTVTDNTGCTDTLTVTVTDIPGVNPTLNISTTNSTCDNPTGGVSLTVTTGVGPYTFSWSNGGTTQNLNNVNGGYYAVTVTGANGCTATIGDTVGFTNTLTISVNSGNSQCNNPTGTLNAVVSGSGTGPFTYQWSHSPNNTSHFNGLPPGVYYLTVTDVNGCSSIASTVIGQSGQTPNAGFSFSGLPCENQGLFTFTHSGTNPTNLDAISWYFPTGTSATGTTASYTNPTAGTFDIIEVVYKGVCTDTQTQTITIYPLPVVTGITSPVNCSVSGSIDITVTSGSSPWSYNWSNGASSQDLGSASAGTYMVTVTESHGCTAVDTFSVTSNGAIVVNYNAVPSTCGNSNGSISITVSGGVLPYTYSWSNGATDTAVYNLAASTYGVSVTDATGCAYPLTVNISDNPVPVVTSLQTDAACGQATGAVDITVVGSSPFTFTWSNAATTEDINSVVAGTYSVTVTDANGCTAVFSMTVNDQGGPVINATSVPTACAQAVGQLNATVLSGATPYTFAWSNGATLQNVTSIDSGVYYLSVTDAMGCMSLDTVNVANTAGPNISLNQLDASCGNSNGQITTVVTNGSSPYTFNWNNGAFNAPDLFSVVSGTYTVVVTDANNCQVLDTVVISDTQGPDSVTFAVINADCSQSNGLVEAAVFGGTTPYAFAWNNGSTNDSLFNVTAGSYTLTVTDANGCSIAGNALVGDNLAPSVTMSMTLATCNNDNGTLDATVTGGVAPYVYDWSNGATTEDISNLSPASYNLTVTDASGCASVITAIVDSVIAPSLTHTVVSTTCAQSNGAVDVTTIGGTAPFSYTWNNGAYAGQDISNLPAGAYTLTLIDANGCVDSLIALVDAVPIPTLQFDVTSATCGYANGLATVIVNGSTGPYTYTWNDANNSIDSFAINVLGNQTYSVTVTDTNNCSIVDTVFVPNVAGPTASAVTDQNVCAGSANGSIDLTVIGGTTPLAFDWNSGQYPTEDINGLTAGTYAVVITDSNSCIAIVVQTVDTFASPVISLTSTNPLCSDSNGVITTSVTSGSSPYSFAWSNASTDNTLNNLFAGTYQLTVTDNNGCIDTNTVILTTTPAVTATATSTDATCNQANGTASLTIIAGTSPYTYAWSNGATNEDITGLTPASYNALVTDSAGCTANVIIAVANANGPNATFTTTDASCNVASGSIDVTMTGGVAPYVFTWSNGMTDEDLANLASGTYNATVSDSTGCQTTFSVIINAVSGPSANYTITNATCGYANGAADVTVTGGATPYAFTWSNAGTTEDIDSVIAGTYAVTIMDANACETSLSFPIGNTAGATFSLNPADATCGNANGSIALNAGNGTLPYTFLWSNGATVEDLAYIPAGQYSVTLSDANNCQTIDTTSVANTGAATLTLDAVNTTCGLDNGSITSIISGGVAPYNFVWNNTATTQDISNLAAGAYTISVTDANNCVTVQTAAIAGSTAPAITLATTPEVCGNANGTITTNVTSGTQPYTFAWYSGASAQNLDSLTAGLYLLTVTDSVGCTVDASATVASLSAPALTVLPIDATCELPNGFVNLDIAGNSTTYTILWSNGATTQNLVSVLAGTYDVTVTDSLGCQATANATLATNQAPDIDFVATQPTCGASNGAISVSAINGQPAYSFAWSNGGSTTNQTNLSQGIYIITVTDQSGCEDTATVNLNPSNGPQLVANALPDTVCTGGTVMLTVSGAQTYSWTPAADLNQSIGDTVFATLTLSTTFTVTGYDSIGCMATQQIAVTVHQNPNIPAIPPTSICEGNSATLTVNGLDTYTWSGNNITLVNGNDATVQPTVTSTYTVTAVDQWGCTSVDSTVVTVNALPILMANINDGSLCIGEQATITVTGASAYNWYPNTGLTLLNDSTAIAAPTAPVNYFIVGSNVGGCVDTTEVFVMVFAPPVISVNPPNPTICELSSTVMTASGADMYSWSPSLGLSATTGDQVTASPGVETTYTVIGSNADGCTASATATIFIGDNLTLSLSPSYPEICLGGSVTLTMLGAEQYTWTPVVTPVDSAYSQVTVSPSVTTTYTVVGSDAGGCTGTMDVVVTVNPLPTVTSNNAIICDGSSAMLYGSGAAYYQWTPTSSLNTGFADSVIATPSVTTTYILYGTSAQGCLDTAHVVVTVTSYPTAIIDSIPTVFCDASAPVTLSAQPAGGVFSGNGVVGNTFDPAAAGPGSHQVVYIYSNGSGCNATDTINLQVDQTPNLFTTNGKDCNGDSSALTVNGASTYTWFPATGLNNTTGANVIASGSTSLTYTIVGTSTFGCSDTAYSTYTVDQLPAVTIDTINPSYCANASAVTLSATPSGGTFSGNGVSGNIFTPSAAGNGTYNIVYSYTDLNGCSASDSQQVIVNAVPNVSVNSPTMCAGETAVLNASGAIAYNWSPTNSLSSGTGAMVTTNAANPTQVVVTGVDVNGCSASATAVITVNPVPQITVNNAAPSACYGNSVIIIAGGATTYQWSPAAGITSTTGNTVIASPNASTTYTVIGTNAFGCSDTLSIPFNVLAAPAAVAGPDAQICEGNSTQLNAVATGSVVWIPDTWLDNAFISEPVATPLQTTTYTVNVTDANGCTASDVVVVTVVNTATIEASGGGTVCLGNSAQLHATGGSDYQWSPATYLASTTGVDVTSTPQESITYTVTANASLGCPATDTVVVDVKQPIQIEAGAGAQVCRGESYQLSANGTGLTYEWTPAYSLDNPYVPYPNATPQSTTTYTVTTSDGICFTASATVVVDVNQPPSLGIVTTQITVVAGTGQQLFAEGNGTFEWSPPTGLSCTDCPDPMANPTQPTTYTVTVTDSAGCRAEGSIALDFLCDENGIYIPNAFTPNGDGKNDEFLIRGYGIKEITMFRVFSRWGELMFETTNAEEGWDGTFKGQQQFPAVYVYYVEGLCTTDQKIVKQGNVTLIR